MLSARFYYLGENIDLSSNSINSFLKKELPYIEKLKFIKNVKRHTEQFIIELKMIIEEFSAYAKKIGYNENDINQFREQLLHTWVQGKDDKEWAEKFSYLKRWIDVDDFNIKYYQNLKEWINIEEKHIEDEIELSEKNENSISENKTDQKNDIPEKINKLKWYGNEEQILSLFKYLLDSALIDEKGYKNIKVFISRCFYDMKNNKVFLNTQLNTVQSRLSGKKFYDPDDNIVESIVKKVITD